MLTSLQSILTINCPTLTFIILWVTFLTSFYGSVESELFSAQVGFEKIYEARDGVIRVMEIYFKQEEQRLATIRKELDRLVEKTVKNESCADTETLTNPLSAFLIVKGLTFDLNQMFKNVNNTKNALQLKKGIEMVKGHVPYPTLEDYEGSAEALRRLQTVYKLDTKLMAQGQLIPGQSCLASEFDVSDSLELGLHSFSYADYIRATSWFQEALTRAQKTSLDKTKMVEIQKDLAMAQENETLFGDNSTIYESDDDVFGLPDYESSCRGELKWPFQNNEAKCRYKNFGQPSALLIGLIKEEVIHVNPSIFIYHDIVSPAEIEMIKSLAKPKLARAFVVDYKTGEEVEDESRVSQSAWLTSDEHPMIGVVEKRLSLITGLDLESSEDFQIVNYGLGGQYENHFDANYHANDPSELDAIEGDRIATLLLYLTDVEAGGATIFPKYGLYLEPKKGAAALWYNLHEDGQLDLKSCHAGCPVLMGSKWVANKWFHERGQEFRRPCLLQPFNKININSMKI